MSDQVSKQCFVLSPIGSEASPERERADRFLLFVRRGLTPVFEVRRASRFSAANSFLAAWLCSKIGAEYVLRPRVCSGHTKILLNT
jgi:hypothetical protein